MPPDAPMAANRGWGQLTYGIRLARGRPVLARLLATMALFSFFSLPFVGLIPSIAEQAFHIDSRSATYKWLYAVFALGACGGGLASGTLLARLDKRAVMTPGFISFGVLLFLFGQARGPGLAFPVGFAMGVAYFLTATAMLTVLQQNLHDHERAPVMALWFMCFGGVVSFGNIVFGPIMDRVGPRWVLAEGAVFSLFLARWCDLRRSRFAKNALSEPFERRNSAALDQYGGVGGE
jgi:MFS family permease